MMHSSSDVNITTGNETTSCQPLNIHVYSSNIGINLVQNVTFNTTMYIRYYDSARSVAKGASDLSTSTNWNGLLLQAAQSQYYEPCALYASVQSSKYSNCVIQYLSGIIFEANFVNASDNSTNGDFYDSYFVIPCGCTTMWLHHNVAFR